MKLVCISDSAFKNGVLQPVSLEFSKESKRMFYYNESQSQLYEVVKFKEQFRSWFVGDSVIQDGSFSMITSIDPIFLFLHFLVNSQKKFMEIDQIVQENDFLYNCLMHNAVDLEVVADLKVIDDRKFARYNETSTLNFLKAKMLLFAKYLDTNSIEATDRSVAVFGFQSGRQGQQTFDDCKRCALNLICSYLPTKLVEQFKQANSELLKEAENALGKNQADKKRKLNTDEKPLEDYSLLLNDSIAKKQKTLTKAEKKLQQIDKKGIRSVASFFKKKS